MSIIDAARIRAGMTWDQVMVAYQCNWVAGFCPWYVALNAMGVYAILGDAP